jgi:polysaccharide export outer membrane protein
MTRLSSSTPRVVISWLCSVRAAWLVLAASAFAVAAAQPPQAPVAHPAAQATPQKTEPGAQGIDREYVLSPGDQIKITVFQNPDLLTETRVSEAGTITFPLIGQVQVGGLSPSAAEARIARKLKDGNFLVDPQITLFVQQIQGSQVAALGQFNRPGRYPLQTTQMRLSDLIATAGGIAATGGDSVIFTGKRNGKAVWKEIDIATTFVNNQLDNDFILEPGDVLFVDRYPLFYIYGEVQRPGSYRVERGMTLVQALAAGGGLTQRGTQRGVRIKRRDAKGLMVELKAELDDPIEPGDVVYVRESLF